MPKLKIDNPVFGVIGTLGDVILLNLLWLVCCVPLVTLGVSTTALFYVARKIIAGEPYHLIADFFHSFRQNWKPATGTWLVLAVVGAIAVIDLFVGFHTPSAMGNLFRGVGIVLFLLWGAVFTLAFPLLSRYEYSVRQILVTSVFLSVRQFPVSLTGIVLLIWVPGLALLSFNAFLFVLPFWVLAGGAASALIISAMLMSVFRQLEKEAGES